MHHYLIPKGETQHQLLSGIQTHRQPHGKVLQPINGLWLDIWYIKYDHYDSKYLLMSHAYTTMKTSSTIAAAADKAGMDRKTARKYLQMGKLPNKLSKSEFTPVGTQLQ